MRVEDVLAFIRRHASGDLTAWDFQAIIAQLEKVRTHWGLVEVTSEILSRAEDLVRRTSLRTLDAIHAASVLTIERTAGLRFAFLSADAVQPDAAVGLSLDLVWLESTAALAMRDHPALWSSGGIASAPEDHQGGRRSP